ncbi:MAG: hypothetical protein V4628_05105 [Pseudomonadota bacterium]
MHKHLLRIYTLTLDFLMLLLLFTAPGAAPEDAAKEDSDRLGPLAEFKGSAANNSAGN